MLLGMVLPSHPAPALLGLSQTCCPTSPLWEFASLLDSAKPWLCLENSYSEKQIPPRTLVSCFGQFTGLKTLYSTTRFYKILLMRVGGVRSQ